MDTKEMLDKLADIRTQLDLLEIEKHEAQNKIYTPEIKAQLVAIDVEFAGKAQAAKDNAAELETQIKGFILATGKTVKGTRLMAVYVKGRSGAWDSDKLLGYSLAHPEILIAKKPDGEPTVTFRSV